MVARDIWRSWEMNSRLTLVLVKLGSTIVTRDTSWRRVVNINKWISMYIEPRHGREDGKT
jgi:hypothetical protein